MLGSIDQRHVLHLLEALAGGEAEGVLRAIEVLDQTAPDYSGVLAELISLLQRLALAQVVPAVLEDDSLIDPDSLRKLAGALSPETIQLFYQIALLGRRDLPLSPEPRGGFEMILLRMLCFRPALDRTASVPAETVPNIAPLSTTATAPAPAAVARTAVAAVPATEWSTIVADLNLSGMVKELALNCTLQGRDGHILRLQLAPECAHLRTKNFADRLCAALQGYYKEPQLRLQIQIAEAGISTPAREHAEQQAGRRQAAVEAIRQDSNVHALCDTFNGQIQPDSITPLD
jgi:DNA polymerase-3 subunit gamma/tau